MAGGFLALGRIVRQGLALGHADLRGRARAEVVHALGALLLDGLGLLPGEAVLDIACGPGS
jgi:hypothetical protein